MYSLGAESYWDMSPRCPSYLTSSMALGSERGTGVFPFAVMLDLALELDFWEPPLVSTPLGKFSGFFGLGVCCGVEQGARIGLPNNSFSGIVGHSAPINDELSFGYTLVPLSAFLELSDFFDIFDDEGIINF